MSEKCELCKREIILTSHHLIPKTLHSNKWFVKNFSKEELNKTIELCKDCHGAIHKFIGEKELGRNYNTVEKLLQNEDISTFVKWISTKKRSFKIGD